MHSEDTTTNNPAEDLNTDTPQYDRGIVPAETAARKDREAEQFGHPHEEQAPESIDVTAGATVDKEGLDNNYAVEPEMYVDEPGDLREEEAALAAERSDDLAAARDNDEAGKLTEEGDTRGKGPGLL